jgi:hypothetical protein
MKSNIVFLLSCFVFSSAPSKPGGPQAKGKEKLRAIEAIDFGGYQDRPIGTLLKGTISL